MINTDDFIKIFKTPQSKKEVSFGKINPSHTSGRPKIIYDIDLKDGTLSKPLPYLASYTPVANDRVMIVKGVVVGKIL